VTVLARYRERGLALPPLAAALAVKRGIDKAVAAAEALKANAIPVETKLRPVAGVIAGNNDPETGKLSPKPWTKLAKTVLPTWPKTNQPRPKPPLTSLRE